VPAKKTKNENKTGAPLLGLAKSIYYFSGVTYIIEVTTGSRPGAGTDANVAIVIQGSKATSPKTKLSNFLENNFEAGK